MSLFQPIQLNCPACRQSIEFQANSSINVDRRPDLRDAILDGTFQTETCPKCSEGFRLDPELNYLDVNRGQWIAAHPFSKLGDWESIELQAREAFDLAYGSKASASAREIGDGLAPRVVFGWTALREKIVCNERIIDDANLELVKMAMLRGMDDVPMSDTTELRLIEVEDDSFVMAWIKGANEEVVQKLGVPRELYREIAGDAEAWQPLRDDVSSGLFVDMQRLMFAAEGG
jgi:hypothetical protein